MQVNKPIQTIQRPSLLLLLILCTLLSCPTPSLAEEKNLLDVWSEIKPPPPVALQPVHLDPKTRGLLILDIEEWACNAERRPRQLLTIGAPLGADRQSLSDHFGEAPIFKLITVVPRNGKVLEERLLANPFLLEIKGKGIKVAQWLLQNRLDILVTRQPQEGKGPGYVFGNAGVEILLTAESNADEALAGVRKELKIPMDA